MQNDDSMDVTDQPTDAIQLAVGVEEEPTGIKRSGFEDDGEHTQKKIKAEDTSNEKEGADDSKPAEGRPTQQQQYKSIADELICPITLELPVNPVIAKDGRIYEGAAIREWIEGKAVQEIKSPWKGELMANFQTNGLEADEVIPSQWILKLIGTLIDASIITGNLAKNWKEKVPTIWKNPALFLVPEKPLKDAFVCKLSGELPFVPVVTELSFVFEQNAIMLNRDTFTELANDHRFHPHRSAKSPEVQWVYSQQVKNVIQTLIDTDAITGEKAKKWKERVQWKEDLLKEAEKGDLKSMEYVGLEYRDGSWGFENDCKTAFKWFDKARKAGSILAMGVAGRMLVYGDGVPRNGVELGMHYVRLAAEKGDGQSCYFLGQNYTFGGFGLPYDKPSAIYWLEKIATLAGASIRLKQDAEQTLKKIERYEWLDKLSGKVIRY